MSFPGNRILLFSNTYLPVVGGVQNVTHNLAKRFMADGNDVRVVTNRYPVSLPAKEEIDGVSVERLLLLQPRTDQLRRGRPDLFLGSLYFGPQSYRRLRSTFAGFRPNVVNVHFPDHQIPFILKLRRQFEFRLIVSLHGHEVERAFIDNESGNGSQPTNDPARVLQDLRAIFREADAVTAVSQALLQRAAQLDPSIKAKSHVINNGIDPARYAEKAAYSHGRPYILGLGRLIHKKGFDLLIDAFAGCSSQNKPDLIIAGAGEEREALQQQVDRMGLTGKVHFFGQASADEVVKLMNGCVGVVIPSRTEPFGIVALEALAAGKPVLATKTGGLEEFLLELSSEDIDRNGQKNITLVEPTAQGLSEGLKPIIEGHKNGAAASYSLPEKFSWASVARRYQDVFLAGAERN